MEDMPPGFRFYPTEEELVSFYLHHKLERMRDDLMHRVIPTVDIYEFNPWDLTQFLVDLCHKDTEQWFFFIPRQDREARGGRPKRVTTDGYWKATGSPGYVYSSNNRPIGVKRTMVFYLGRAPTGRKTDWKLNEYKAIVGTASPDGATPILRHEFSLCRIYKKLSRCLRQFDRRPEAAGRGLQISQLPAADHHHHHQGQATGGSAVTAIAYHQQSASPQMAAGAAAAVAAAAAERSMSSSESSSPGDHGNYTMICQTGETSNTSSAMLVDLDEAFWYLDGFWEYST